MPATASSQSQPTRAVDKRTEAFDVYIGRGGSPWGNPFPLQSEADRADVIARFRAWAMAQPWFLEAARRELAGQRLGCFCAPRACHGDVLAEVADAPPPAARPVFVFGSNQAGRHGKGAAAVARRHYGAEAGVGEGATELAYAIPTKDADLATQPVAAFADAVARFLDHARAHPDTPFLVTRIGCGLAGYSDDAIAPLFSEAPANVFLPGVWRDHIGMDCPARVVVAGSRDVTDYTLVRDALDRLLARLASPVIVAGGARGVDQLAERYAAERDLALERFPAWWATEGKAAGRSRNARMAWRGTHLVAFWDGQSRGTRSMIDTAQAEGLRIRTVRTA